VRSRIASTGAVTVVASFLTVACGTSQGAATTGPGSGTLDCAWAAGDNCWKSVIAAASACLPGSDEKGTLSADARTCTYPSGHTIAFADALVRSGKWSLPSFTLTTNGSPCLRLDEAANAVTVTTPAGAVTLSQDTAGATLTVACPGGPTTSGPVAGLSACKDAAPGLGEGCACSSSSNDAGTYTGRFTFSLDGTSGPQGTTLAFDCGSP
jgi:hypothetical protein